MPSGPELTKYSPLLRRKPRKVSMRFKRARKWWAAIIILALIAAACVFVHRAFIALPTTYVLPMHGNAVVPCSLPDRAPAKREVLIEGVRAASLNLVGEDVTVRIAAKAFVHGHVNVCGVRSTVVLHPPYVVYGGVSIYGTKPSSPLKIILVDFIGGKERFLDILAQFSGNGAVAQVIICARNNTEYAHVRPRCDYS